MEMAAPHWEKLSADEKEEYKVKAKFTDTEVNIDGNDQKPRKRKRLNCFGDDIEELQINLDIERQTYEDMTNDIKNLVTGASDLGGNSEDLQFFLCF
jgi:hypothetical protein